MIKFAKPMIGEKERHAVSDAVMNERLTEGPLVEEFERKFGERFGGYAVAVSSCTAALHLSGKLLASRVIIVPAMTHPATALAMEAAGHRVVFVDCDEYGLSEAEVAVQFLGQANPPTGYIDDAATALHHRDYGPLSCFSFYPAKQMTTGEGGMVLCKDRDAAKAIRSMRAFGKPDFSRFGLNYRMSEIAAALGIAQLERLGTFIAQRRSNEAILREELKGFELIGDNYALSVILPKDVDRDAVRAKMLENGVESSIYYPIPVPHTPYFGETTSYPNAERISSRSITLSVGPHLDMKDMKTQANALKESLSSAVPVS